LIERLWIEARRQLSGGIYLGGAAIGKQDIKRLIGCNFDVAVIERDYCPAAWDGFR